MNNGFIKLYRKSIDSQVFQSAELWKLWCLCLLKANHKEGWFEIPGVIEPIKVMPGQFVTGRFELHKDYYPRKKKKQKTPLTVWRWLEKLKNMQNLNIETNNKYSVITINNWDSYQFKESKVEHQNEQQVNNRRTTDEQQMITNKNVKECKETIYVPYQKIVDLYHTALPELPKVKVLSEERKKTLKARWNSGYVNNDGKAINTLDFWESYFQWVRKSKYLMGDNQHNWMADFEFLITKSKFIKVVEGKYH